MYITPQDDQAQGQLPWSHSVASVHCHDRYGMILYMLIQKLYRSGNSIAVTIPKEYLNSLRLKEGSSVVVEQDPEAGIITISHKKAAKPISKVSPEFLTWLNSFNKKYGPALKELAKR